MVEPIDTEQLNPNIRRVVAWLRKNGFETVNSGDGQTHECECDADYPYVTILVNPLEMAQETLRLYGLLSRIGIMLGCIEEDGSGIAVECTWNPAWNQPAAIVLSGVHDKMLIGAKVDTLAELIRQNP